MANYLQQHLERGVDPSMFAYRPTPMPIMDATNPLEGMMQGGMPSKADVASGGSGGVPFRGTSSGDPSSLGGGMTADGGNAMNYDQLMKLIMSLLGGG